MNHRFFIWPVVAVLFLFGISESGSCNDARDLIEQMTCGSINWSRGVIQATGIQAPADKSYGKPLDRLAALAAAKDTARQNLLSVVKAIRMDSGQAVGERFANNDIILAKITEMVNEAPVVRKAYLSDGTVEVTLEMNMHGGFSQLVLPPEIKQIESIKTVSSGRNASQTETEAQGAADPVSSSEPNIYTGLVVDARGIQVTPTLYPKIYDESGMEVYGSAFASREFAVQQGMSRYEKDIETAVRLPRVAGNPLIVKGLRTTQPGHTDIVISNADASKLRGNSRHLSFLKKCRVLIVVE